MALQTVIHSFLQSKPTPAIPKEADQKTTVMAWIRNGCQFPRKGN
jgi:hypothetical protein